jgi:hypothetical protein
MENKPLTKSQAIQACKKELREWIMVKRLYHLRIDEINACTVRVSAVHDGVYYSRQAKFNTNEPF